MRKLYIRLLLFGTALICLAPPRAAAQNIEPMAPPDMGAPSPATNAPVAEQAQPAPPPAIAMTNADFTTVSEIELLSLPHEEALEGELFSEEKEPAEETPIEEDLISITLDDVEMLDVVRMFTRISGANIIASPTNLTGRVTVNLTNVKWRPALESILDMHGLTLDERSPGSGVFSITPTPPGAPEPMRVQTYFLEYATVTDVEPVIKSMLIPGGFMSTYDARNALVVKSTAANLGEIETIVLDIDKQRQQVFIEAKFMELNDEARRDLGVDWSILQGYGITAGSLAWSQNDERAWTSGREDGVLRRDNRGNLDNVNKMYDIDDEQFQDATAEFVESPPDSGNYVEQVLITPTRTIDDTRDSGLEIGSELTDGFSKTVSEIRTAVIGADQFRVILSALKQQNGVTVVSNPKIIVANNQVAVIHIGEKEPNIRGSVTPGQQGQANTTTYTLDEIEPYFQFGISLEVTPTINTESNITVNIIPKLTRFVKDKLAPDGTTFPITSTKEIKTVFSMENGKTAAIGGLTETTERKTQKKIPLLGDIPLLGKYLFSHETTENLQKETIIFVTIGLAMPSAVLRESGLPENTMLVRKRMIGDKARNTALEADLELLRQAADADISKSTDKAKSNLLKRRK